MNNALAVLALGLLLAGCGGGDEQAEEHDHGHGGGETITVPDEYVHAVEMLEELSAQIDDLIADGHLDDVHHVAENIKKVAERLPALASSDLPQALLKDVNIKSKELAGLFLEIDEVADAGKQGETAAVHSKMKQLIADLKKHASSSDGDHADGDHDDDR